MPTRAHRLAVPLLAVLAASATNGAAAADDLAALAREFWAWRARTQPFNRDDISRIERPEGWKADWSAAAMAERRRALEAFETRRQALDPSGWPVPRQVDLRHPRADMVHEGVPGHYFQMALSWKHEDEIRRRYYDSGANEGIGFYAEEMMLQAGLFDDSPRTRDMIYSYMRLRALRVEVDVKLALGLFTIDQAADYLARTVPLDAQTARQEASFFASVPGQAITYQIGKLQIVRFLADARRVEGGAFLLRAFHDFVWKNGNVPLALQRWELLGLVDEIALLDGR
jgi:Bacterial protein of unknown function (DUF885)